MSLYNDASLAMIPSAVKDGKLYSIRPTDGSGDFTFSRGSNLAATRVDVNGLIEKGRENLLLQSNQFDTTWVTSNASVTSGQTGYDGSSDAWRLNALNTSSVYIYQGNFSTLRTQSIYAKAGTADQISIIVGGYGQGVQFDLTNGTIVTNSNTSIYYPTIVPIGATGWYRISVFIAPSAPTYSFLISPEFVGSGGISVGEYIYIQDAQLEVGLVATDYIETTTTTAVSGITEDLPRLDYSGGASCPSLLLEPQRTNLITYSEDFFNSSWTKSNVTVLPNTTISPSGELDASTLIDNVANAYILFPLNSYNAVSGQTITISIFTKSSSQVLIFGGATPSGTDVYLIEDYENGWYRQKVTRTFTTTLVGQVQFILFNLSDTIVWGAQAEAGSYATSYIPTYGSAVTRSSDAVSITDIQTNGLIGSNQGSFVFHYKPYNAYTASSGEIYDFRIDSNNRMATYFNNGTLRLFSNILGSTNFNQATSLNGDTEFKIGVGYDADSTLVYINGALTYTLNGFDLGVTDFDISPPANGSKVADFYWFPTKLTATELADLTTL